MDRARYDRCQWVGRSALLSEGIIPNTQWAYRMDGGEELQAWVENMPPEPPR